tara:strand:- start:243 stop:524 length:282 start_codon:yes stop_codon:yes gene_type:complete
LGDLTDIDAEILLAGKKVARHPTKPANIVRNNSDLDQTRGGSELKKVIKKSTNTKATLQQGPAQIGVSKNIRTHRNFNRGSSLLSQLDFPVTY